MDTETEIFIAEQAEIIARKAIEGFRPATQNDVGKRYEAYELVAMNGKVANYPSYTLREEIEDAAIDIIVEKSGDPWGAPWVRAEEPPDPQDDLFAENHQ